MVVSIPGYKINDAVLYESPHIMILTGQRLHDKKSVVIKFLKKEYPSLLEIENFKHEFEITKLFDDTPEIVHASDFQKIQNKYAIIFEYDNTDSLSKFILKLHFSIEDMLKLALKITNAIGKIHQHNVIHCDINPSNILYNRLTKDIKIIDFGLSVTLKKDWASIVNPKELMGTLPYLSPEQTGRMNRGIDYRTDFYSFGITLFQLLTGKLPFISEDPMELIHSHIAIQPKSPHETDPTIPEAISSITMKLLSKNADERYLNANGIAADLENCLEQLKKTGEIRTFELGKKDIFDHFQIPEKLYGREKEVEIVLNTFDHVAQGNTELLLVTGYSGIGKSSLVYEVQKPIVKKHGYFISGKFDQYKRNIPYVAFTDAFTDLVKQILTENETKISSFRTRILEAARENGQVLIDVIPSLVLVIGKQPPVIELGPTESLNRLSNVFQNFILALCSKEHPLCIFLDDLQWADLPSLNMLETLVSSNAGNLLIIGAYRSNEVSGSHPLLRTKENLKKNQILIKSIELEPLRLESVRQLIADTLHQSVETVSSLARICYEKTQGNPFFLMQVLETLYKEKLIEFDWKNNQWTWDLEQIQKKKISDNVVDLMLEKIRKLTPASQKVLQFAACIGNKFNLKILTEIARKNLEEVLIILEEIMIEGFIIKRGMTYEIPVYQFVHDRIEQAAHSMLKEDERRAIHLEIARLFLKNTPEDQIKDEIFNIANHFNSAITPEIPETISPDERKQIAELNLRAAKIAKSAAAYEPALRYAEMSIKCQVESTGKSDDILMFDTYAEAAENASLNSKFDLMEKYAALSLKHSKNLLDKIRITNIKIRYYNTQNNYKESINISINMLKDLGINLRYNSSKIEVLFAILKVKALLFFKDIPGLYDLPVTNDPLIEATQGLLSRIFLTALLTNDGNLLALIVCKSISLSIQYGNTKYSPLSFAAYGMICCGILNEFETGYQMGQLAHKLMEQLNPIEQRTSVGLFNNAFISHWKDSVNIAISELLKNYENGMHIGEREYSFYCLVVGIDYSVFSGKNLKELLNYTETQRIITKRNNIINVYLALSMTEQLISNSIEIREKQSQLTGQYFDEFHNDLSNLTDKDIAQLTFRIFFLKLFLSYIFEETENKSQVMEYIKKCDETINSITSSYIIPLYNFYKSIALMSIYPNSSSEEKKRIKKIVKSNQKSMKKWVDFSPENKLGKYLIIEAEWASKILGQTDKAIKLYDQAITVSSQSEFCIEEGIANELLAKLYLTKKNEKIAKVYLRDARQAFLVWGSDAKVAQLNAKYRHLLEQEETGKPDMTSGISGRASSANLDIATIQKCSQSISSTIILTDLLKIMMGLVIENAGAEKGFFILNKDGKYSIEAEGSVEKKDAEVLQSIDITEETLPVSIINLVIHSKESVVLDNATETNRFATDPYIVKNKPKSILCMPLLNQGVLTAILYLENNLVPKAFTKDRIDLLNLISSQIAISIDNARLYASTVDLNKYLAALNTSYERFVPKDFLNLLKKTSIVDVRLGDHIEGRMSVLFTDIRNFTSRSEKMSPTENFEFINSFLNIIAPIIRKNRGFIDKYIGDAIMALFPEDADDAILCALEMQRVLSDYNAMHNEQEPIRIGIGINTGLLMLGTVGEEHRLGATVISDAVNVASRVESLTKTYSENILITESTYNNLRSPERYSIEKVGETEVKGKSKQLTIYRVKASITAPLL